MTKYSLQRELIKENVKSRKDHPTADMVYQSICKELPNISLGTVYRNLKFLVNQGEVLSLKLSDGKEHFDGDTRLHCHFICNQCNAVEDIFIADHSLREKASKLTDGQITDQCTYFSGLCHKCLENSNNRTL